MYGFTNVRTWTKHRAHRSFQKPVLKPRPKSIKRTAVVQVVCKQYVPSDSFGGWSPERKAAQALRNLFTFIAARIVLAQLEGSGRGNLAAYDKHAYDDLITFLQDEPMKDCDEWLTKLMRKNQALALRLMEVRTAYANEDFEWDNVKLLAQKDLVDGNVQIMRQLALASMKVATTDSLDMLPQERLPGDSVSTDDKNPESGNKL